MRDLAPDAAPAFLGGGGEVGALMRGKDWSRTPLGPPETWSPVLRTFTELLLASKQPMFIAWGPELCFLYNDAYAPIFGRKHPDGLGRAFAEVWSDIWPQFGPIVAATLSGDAQFFEDLPIEMMRNGYLEETFFSFSYTPLRDETGAVAGLFCAATESTAKVRSERQVTAENARLSSLFEQAPSFMCVLRGPEHRFELLNRAYQQLVGHRDLLGKTVREALPEVEGQGFFELLDQVYTTGEPFNGRQLRVELRPEPEAEPKTRFLDFIYQPIVDASGGVTGIFVEGSDVSDTQQAQQALRELNDTLEARVTARTAERDRLWTLSEDMLAWANYDGTLSAVNPAWSKVLGWSEHELLTNPYADIIHPDDVETTVAALTRMGETGAPTRFQNQIRAKTGVWTPIEWTVAPEPNGASFIAVGRDISLDKARERALAETQDQLRQSQKMEAVGQLTGGIAHDFNNLLQGITGSLDLVQKRIAQGRTGELDRFISGAVTSANRAAALTHRLLAFSRRQPLDPRPVKPNPLVASMEDLLRRTIGENIDLELVLAGGLWPTLCDPNQLESAILNLVINARDAMPDGGRLTVETCNAHLDSAYAARSREVRPGQYVCICITDTGSGMSPEVIERAFDPFFTTKAIGQGTGLGLSMIYGFARQSEGYCKIYSEVGQGTTIKLYLPRHHGEAAEETAPPTLSEVHLAEDGEVVVVVEDEPVVRGLIVEVLAELGYRALEAHDGPSGIALLGSASRVDLLITDIGLPGMNGRQVADAARARRPELKVLFMTGYAENAAIANGFLEPGMSMITKPFAMEALATRIRGIIEDGA